MKEIIIGLFITVVGGILVLKYQKYQEAQEKQQMTEKETRGVSLDTGSQTQSSLEEGNSTEPKANSKPRKDLPVSSEEKIYPEPEIVKPQPETPQQINSSTAKSGNLTFNLVGCNQTEQFISCHCKVKSEDRDVDLSIFGKDKTRIIDGNSGKEFNPISIKIGGKTGGGAYYGTKKTIVEGYPVDILIEFGDVTFPVENISKLEMTINQAHTGTGSNKVEFRNILIGNGIGQKETVSKARSEAPKLTPRETAKVGELTFKLKKCSQF